MCDERAATYEQHVPGNGWIQISESAYRLAQRDPSAQLRIVRADHVGEAADYATVPDDLLVSLYYAAQGNITAFRVKARGLLAGFVANAAGGKATESDATDLLEALIDAVDCIKNICCSDNSCEPMMDLSDFEAVIAKATGEQS